MRVACVLRDKSAKLPAERTIRAPFLGFISMLKTNVPTGSLPKGKRFPVFTGAFSETINVLAYFYFLRNNYVALGAVSVYCKADKRRTERVVLCVATLAGISLSK